MPGWNASLEAGKTTQAWGFQLGRKNLKREKDVAITNFAIEHLLEYR